MNKGRIFKLIFSISLFCLWAIDYRLSTELSAAPCYGTRLPEKHKAFIGLQSHSLFKRDLEDNFGEIRSNQYFFLLSYGLLDSLSIDLKGAAADIRHRPADGSEVDYSAGFAGGYGLRVKLIDCGKTRMVFGFQHISVHPKGKELNGLKNWVILDDWQASVLASYDFKGFTPYLGTRWSRVDLIHKDSNQRLRKMSEPSKSYGLILGLDLAFTEKIWLNLEGSFFDSESLSFSVNYKF